MLVSLGGQFGHRFTVIGAYVPLPSKLPGGKPLAIVFCLCVLVACVTQCLHPAHGTPASRVAVNFLLQRLVVKAAAMGKLQRTDTDDNHDEQPTVDAGTQDSVQTAYHQHLQQQQQQLYPQQYSHPAMAQQPYTQQQQHQKFCQHSEQQDKQQLEAQEDFEGSSSEVEGPVADDKYIKGTRLIINGWFQACRYDCTAEATRHTCCCT